MNLNIEIELNGTITIKRIKIPSYMRYQTRVYQYIREYFINLGYVVGDYIRIC